MGWNKAPSEFREEDLTDVHPRLQGSIVSKTKEAKETEKRGETGGNGGGGRLGGSTQEHPTVNSPPLVRVRVAGWRQAVLRFTARQRESLRAPETRPGASSIPGTLRMVPMGTWHTHPLPRRPLPLPCCTFSLVCWVSTNGFFHACPCPCLYHLSGSLSLLRQKAVQALPAAWLVQQGTSYRLRLTPLDVSEPYSTCTFAGHGGWLGPKPPPPTQD